MAVAISVILAAILDIYFFPQLNSLIFVVAFYSIVVFYHELLLYLKDHDTTVVLMRFQRITQYLRLLSIIAVIVVIFTMDFTREVNILEGFIVFMVLLFSSGAKMNLSEKKLRNLLLLLMPIHLPVNYSFLT